MLLDKKEWLVAIFAIAITVPGVWYYFFNPYYVKNKILDPGISDTICVTPHKIDDKKLIIKLNGESSTNYSLKLNLFSRQKDSQRLASVHSEMVNIPAGNFNGSFTRNFQANIPAEKAEIIFLPNNKTAKGKINIEAGIF